MRYGAYSSYSLEAKLAGVRMKDYYTSPEAAAKVYTTGTERVREVFGDMLVITGPRTPAVSYIHLSAIGAELVFPEEDGEPNIRPRPCESLEEATEHLRRPVDFEQAEWVRYYLEFTDELDRLLGRKCARGLGVEGPITSAVLFYGMDFYAAMLEEPEQAKEFLDAMSDSIIAFSKFRNRLAGVPDPAPGHGICDDLSSLVSPTLWPEFVLPYWEKIYSACTNGSRSLHCENLREEHLPLLNRVGLSFFDPSHAPALTPAELEKHLKMPWQWRVQSVHMLAGPNEIRRQVHAAAEHNANRVVLYAMANSTPEHIRTFVEAAESVGAVRS